MDISSISTYTDYLTKQNTKADELQNTLKKTDYSEANDDKLLDACKQFESYLLEQVFKEMQTVSSQMMTVIRIRTWWIISERIHCRSWQALPQRRKDLELHRCFTNR